MSIGILDTIDGLMAHELVVRNPYNGIEIRKLSFAEPAAIRATLERATASFSRWRNSSAWDRSQLLNGVAAQLETRKEDFAATLCQEAGKPISYARAEVDRALSVLRWAAGEAQRFGGELLRLDAGATGRRGFGINTRFPRGVILGITPFNFPLNLVLHKVAPAVAAGCAIVIKPSPATPLTALKLAELFEALQPGLVQVALADDAATESLTRAPEVAMISFTGSARIGWLIRKQAPEKITALELGGNAWVLVMEDTPRDLFPAIAKRIANAAYGYAGQSCISVQNVAVAPDLWPELRDHLAQATEQSAYGNPEDAKVIAGPVIRAEAAGKIKSELSKAPAGSQIVTSKSAVGGVGEPTMVAPALVLLDRPESDDGALVQEELFGPVMTARKFADLDQLIGKINSSRYGLQTGVYTQHWPTIEKLYRELNVGGLVVNDVPTTRYDHQPYGGVKDSGQGREGLRYAMEEMTDSKFLALSSQLPL